MKRISVTIGIPAYNEEANIGELLRRISQQKQTSYVIKQIIVFCDGSTDKTERIVRSIKNQKLTLTVNSQRMGQIYCQNMIFAQADTDAVVLIESDTLPQSTMYLETLIKPFIRNPSVGMMVGNPQSLPAQTYIEKVVRSQRQTYLCSLSPQLLQAFPLCSGRGGRVFFRAIYRNFQWPPSVPEDLYAHLWCLQKHAPIVYQENAIIFYRGPQTYNDYKREKQKIRSGLKAIYAYFDPTLVKSVSYQSTLMESLRMTFTFAYKHPFFFCFYAYIKLRTFLEYQESIFTDFWPVTPSTKIFTT